MAELDRWLNGLKDRASDCWDQARDEDYREADGVEKALSAVAAAQLRTASAGFEIAALLCRLLKALSAEEAPAPMISPREILEEARRQRQGG